MNPDDCPERDTWVVLEECINCPAAGCCPYDPPDEDDGEEDDYYHNRMHDERLRRVT